MKRRSGKRTSLHPAWVLLLLVLLGVGLSVGCGLNIFAPTSERPRGPIPDGPGPKTPPPGAKSQGNERVGSFSTAKRELMQIHRDHAKTFYCGCAFSSSKAIDLKSCGYTPRSSAKRARRVEFEHVVPASELGHAFAQWEQGHPSCRTSKGKPYKGRRCLEKTSAPFRLMQADMHNLQPAIGEVNGDRSNYPMATLSGEARAYGACDVEIRDQRIEPSERVRGDIARTYLYMDWAYPGVGLLDAAQRRMFEAWSQADPPDRWERTRAARIQKVQGNANPFIK